jgi:hypothetical protein
MDMQNDSSWIRYDRLTAAERSKLVNILLEPEAKPLSAAEVEARRRQVTTILGRPFPQMSLEEAAECRPLPLSIPCEHAQLAALRHEPAPEFKTPAWAMPGGC